MIGWHTTVGANGKAHYLLDSGKTACADRKGIWPGMTLGELFKRPWRETGAEDHVCFYCDKEFPRRCACWRCDMKRAGALRPGRVR